MFGAFTSFGKLGSLARAIAAAWTPSALWPTGTEAGMWIDPSTLTTMWQDSAGTTPVSTPGTVADSANPVGLALDIRAGATALTDPGNHLLQATSTARPLLSARVNWLNRDSDINPQTGDLFYATLTQTAVAPPIGTGPVYKLVGNAAATQHRIVIYPAPEAMNTAVACFTFFAKAAEVRRCYIFAGQDYGNVWFDTMSGTCGPMPEYTSRLSYSITSVGDGWYRCQMTVTNPSFLTLQLGLMADGGTTFPETSVPMDGLGMYLWGVQAEFGLVPEPYQSIVGNGSSYPSTGFPIYQHFDGTDDGMATATFAAGTLTSSMDCLIAVRRDSGANMVCGLYEPGRGNAYFGAVSDGSPSTCMGPDVGYSWTILVDGTLLAGGTSVTQGQLSNALTVGEFHILEFRNIELNSWQKLAFGMYGSGYNLNGAFGGILLFPSSTSTADRDAARTWLGAKVGLTL